MDKYDQVYVEKIEHLTSLKLNSEVITQEIKSDEDKSLLENSSKTIRYFTNKKLKYIWNNELNNFVELKSFENYSLSYFQQHKSLTPEEEFHQRMIYGENLISISITPIFKLFIREILSPFYIFQIFSCALWFYELYIYFATCIVLISTVSIIYSLHSIRRNERALISMIHNVNQVNIIWDLIREDAKSVSSDCLVPGHVIEIKNKTVMQCDALLLEDSNAIVNESMLTGESNL